MLRAATLLQTQRAQHIGQSLCVDDPQRFRQRRMTRRLSTDKAQPCFLPPGQAASKNKSRLHPPPAAQQRQNNQAQDRPQLVVLPLFAARVRNALQNRFQLHAKASANQEASLESEYYSPFK